MRAFVSITDHGFGHLAQTAPVVRALQQRVPALEIYVCTALPEGIVKQAIPGAIVEASIYDNGVVMNGISCAPGDVIASAWRNSMAYTRAYQSKLSERLHSEKFDLVISGISPWPLAAAKAIGIPSFGVGSFVWSDILLNLCHGEKDIETIISPIIDAYKKATLLFRLSPGLGMAHLDCVTVSRVIATLGNDRREQISKTLDQDPEKKIILLAFGGMLPRARPSFIDQNNTWVVLGPKHWADCNKIFDTDIVSLPFADIVASADLVITKAGYGISCELACLGKPSIIVQRADWPEDKALASWLSHYAVCSTAPSIALIDEPLIRACLETPRNVTRVANNGGEDVIADTILNVLR